MTERRLTVGSWVYIAIGAGLLLYPLSIGPVGWVVIKCGSPEWTRPGFEFVYAPLVWLQDYGPESVRNLITWYFDLWWGA